MTARRLERIGRVTVMVVALTVLAMLAHRLIDIFTG
jgi:hypothetical protein